jgi:hypothetical protein
MNARFTVLFMFVALSVSAQTNLVRETHGTDKMLLAAPSPSPSQTNQIEPVAGPSLGISDNACVIKAKDVWRSVLYARMNTVEEPLKCRRWRAT